jgi:endonuclease YncB( thermonuclease family)
MTNHRKHVRMAAAAVTAVAALVASMLLTTLPAQAGSSALQYGKVVFVDDGDTVDVDLQGDGTSKPVRVRFIGIQAMELHVYSHTLSKLRGECWGVDAARNLHRLVAGKQVRLTARRASSASTHNVRPRRFVSVRVNGVWTDVGAMQLDAGLVLPDLIPDEFSHNLDYAQRSQAAAANGVGFWGSSSRCGIGPSQEDQVKVDVNWDADGNDGENVNGEWVDVTNVGVNPLDLSGWWVRDAAYRGYRAHGYTFPAGTVVAPGDRVRLKIGHGTNGDGVLHWGLDIPIFANVTGSRTFMGDGAWLYDPNGDLRAWDMYPCRAVC